MKVLNKKLLLLVATFSFTLLSYAGLPSFPVREQPLLEWEQLTSLPDDTDVLSGFFGGMVGDMPVVAGGEKRVADSGQVLLSDAVYGLKALDEEWGLVGKLPQAMSGGLSLGWKDSFILVGGRTETGLTDAVLLATPAASGSVIFTELPSLPQPLWEHAGAIAGNSLYVFGGLASSEAKEAENVLYSLNLNAPQEGWRTLSGCPGGGRHRAVAEAIGSTLYIFGGVSVSSDDTDERIQESFNDSWSYHPELGWKRLADAPYVVTMPSSAALAIGQSHLFLSSRLLEAKRGESAATQNATTQNRMLAYHNITDTWAYADQMPFFTDAALVIRSGADYLFFTQGKDSEGREALQVWAAKIIQTKAGFGFINYLALALYLMGMVLIGWVCARRNKTTDDYFKAGGRIPWWAAGIAIYATMLSSLTFMALPAKAYAMDWTFVWANAGILIIAPILVKVYLPFFRRLNIISAYEYLEKRFSMPVRIYGSFSFIIYQLGRQAVVLLLPSLALATVSDLNVNTCIILMGSLCVLYTVMGGMAAVIWTDVAQTVLFIGAALVSLVLIIFGTEGGLGGFWETAISNGKFHMFNFTWSPTMAANAFWVILIGNIFGQLVPYTSDQAVVQRYMTTETESKAARSIWFNAILVVPSTILFFLIGTALYVFYRSHPEQLDPSQATDSIFPLYIVQNLPIGIAGLVIAAIFAAAQSTVSGSLNSVVAAIMSDFYQRFGGKAEGGAALLLARILTAVLGVLATLAALALAQFNLISLWDAYSSLVGLTVSSLAGLFALGIFSSRTSAISAWCGVIVSICVLYYVQAYTELHFFLYAGIGVLTCFTVGWLTSFIFPSRKPVDGLTFKTLR